MKLFVLLFGLSISLNTLANSYWTKELHSSKQSNSNASYVLDIDAFNIVLADLKSGTSVEVSLPRQNGEIEQFIVSQTQVLASDLALKYPDIKTFKIQHISDSAIHGRMELIEGKLSAVIKTSSNNEYINLSNSITAFQRYSIKNKKHFSQQNSFSCGTKMRSSVTGLAMKLPENSQYRPSVNSLKKLRIAIATTVEYSTFFGGTKALVLAEIASALNRINEVYESELAITLELVNDNDDIIFLTTDDYVNNDASQMIDENQTVIDNVIGNSNYDIGHVFSTGGGGLASLQSVCSSSSKANGVTGRSSPINDPFWIDYVAHEIGHQLGAEHTFNGTSASCSSGNRVGGSAYEPGSGSTIMAYAGICGAENIQNVSDASFHFNSINEIDSTLASKSNCGTNVSYNSIHPTLTNLNSPTANAGIDHNIPMGTPFMLTGTSSDADGDARFYQWDGADQGSSTNSITFGSDNGGVLFRSNLPQVENERYFPKLTDLLSNSEHKAETLPTTSRDVNLNLKVTDNKGGIATDSILLQSSSTIGPFKVTSQCPSVSYTAGEVVTVEWDVANTTSPPVSCTSVEIQLLNMNTNSSSFCKQTLATAEFNDGLALVRLPDETSAVSRFLVKCENNVFFNVNQADFSIAGGSTTATSNCFSTGGTGGSIIATSTSCAAKETNTSSSSGGGAFSLSYLFFYLFLLRARRYFNNF